MARRVAALARPSLAREREELATLPVGLFGAAVATVLFPTLARLVASAEDESLGGGPGFGSRAGLPVRPGGPALTELFVPGQKGWVSTALVLAPFAAILLVLPAPVVDPVYGRGAFGPEAISLTATAAAYHAGAVVAWVGRRSPPGRFTPFGDSLTPVKVLLTAAVIKTAVSFAAAPLLGLGGPASSWFCSG